MPHILRTVDRDVEVLPHSRSLPELDDDITGECTRTINRLRNIPVQIYPPVARDFAGEVIQLAFVLDWLIHYAGPAELKPCGKKMMLAWAGARTKRDPEALVDRIFQALDAQTVTVPGSAAPKVAV